MWIRQLIRESQATYPNISKTPAEVLSHLLFTNGNGHDILNGNFVKRLGYWDEETDEWVETKIVPYSEYYIEDIPFETLKEKEQTEEAWKIFEEEQKDLCSWVLERNPDYLINKFNTQFDNIVSVDNFTDEELEDPKVWRTIVDQMEYIPHLDISPKYFKLFFFNKKTDKQLVRISLAFMKAALDLYNELNSLSDDELKAMEPRNQFENPTERKFGMEYSFFKPFLEKIPSRLEEEIQRLENLL